jgi:zinc transport system substrate-binding protein
MPKLIKIILIPVCLLLLSCSNNEGQHDEINISVSIEPFADFTKQIVGNRANVNTLIPPGINVHSFELKPQEIKQVLESDIYFRVGKIFNLENLFLDKVETSIGNVIDCSFESELINNNPHYWLSPSNVKIITKNILDALVKYYPQHKNFFTNNRTSFIHKIDSIDSIISNQLEDKKEKIILVYHPAWTYLADYFGLKEISIERDGKSPKAQDLLEIIDFAKTMGVSCIFFDPHFDESSVVTIAESLNLEIDSIDPLPANYLSNLADIGEKLNKYLK